ncbi:30S ribosomal protein S28e [Nanobdella aerobiophila]|uniref:30S ribosomal protein S28e n=1 Tax=Nanobdella aerobiophila TaxID=2586965 RepID=A0A915SFS5_9ARCH|nr:30S ribosomal protein S28e [Nanobdella aerobiophila]BBL45599.1 30S ribosomal protein S28e [Nanobdella aerobiophila]
MPRKVENKVSEEGVKHLEDNIIKENTVNWSKAYKGEIIDLIGRTGMRGEAIHAIIRVAEGPDAGKIIRKNITGPIRKGDIILLRDTEISAMPIEKKE